jgi:hypothetical protein
VESETPQEPSRSAAEPISATPEQLGALIEQVVLATKKRDRKDKEEEKEAAGPAEPPPYFIPLDTPPEVVSATLRDLLPFVDDEVRGRWGHDVPKCWFWHKPLTFVLLAARSKIESMLTMSPDEVISFFGWTLFHQLDETLIEHDGRRPPQGHSHHKKMTLSEFIECGWMDYIWLGAEPPDGDGSPATTEPEMDEADG